MTATVSEIYDGGLTEFLELYATLPSNDTAFFRGIHEQFPGVSVELGIGVGRVAKEVHPTYAVDLSESAINRCRQLLQTHTPIIVHDNFLTYRLPEEAQLTYLPACTVMNIPPADRRALFTNVLRNTAPGGHFAFDSLVPNPEDYKLRGGFPLFRARTPSWLMYELISEVNLREQRFNVHYIVDYLDEDGSVRVRRYYPSFPLYYAHPEEYEGELKECGWEVREVWGGYNRERLTRNSDYHVWLVRKPI